VAPSGPIPAVVLSACVNALGVTRALGRRGVPVVLATRDPSGPTAQSRYVCDVWPCEDGEDALPSLLLARGGEFRERPVLFPITDRDVMTVSRYRHDLQRFFRIGLPDHDVVERAMSKRGFADWAGEFDLPIPTTLFIDSLDHLRAVLHDVPLPCIVKPDFQTPSAARPTHLKTARADTAEEVLERYERLAEVSPHAVVQQWIPGGDGDVYFCLQYYDRDGRPAVSFCGRKIRQWPPLCGSTASCEPSEDGGLSDLATRFFRAIGFRGLCSMEFKRLPDDGTHLMVEPTVGRTDWQSAVANANGVPIPYVAYRDLAGLPPEPVAPSTSRVKWVRWSSDTAAADYYRRKGELGRWQRVRSICPPVRWSVWSVTDPGPYLRRLWARMRQRVRRLWNRLPFGQRLPETNR
jgi:predicted ATP-grasp superfamily ATP-dependent carboligase